MLHALVALWLASDVALAACTVTLDSPVTGDVLVSTPTYAWSGHCAEYQVIVWVDGAFADRRASPWTTDATLTPTEDL